MNQSVVNVLTPNGRRQNVKVTLNTPILKVLEEVCQKHKFDANEYDLKHHKRIVDLTTSFRFSGLPNNAQLEMVEAQKKREDVDIELVVQLSDGKRISGQFKSNITVSSIVQELCPDEHSTDLVAIFMRTEIPNVQLGETTLKDLGLSSGSGLVRLMHRRADAAKIQANVALNLQPKPVEICDEPPVHEVQKNENINQKAEQESEVFSKPTTQAPQEKAIEHFHEDDQPSSSQKMDVDSDNKQTECSTTEMVQDPESDEEDDGEVHILGPRNAILFSMASMKSAHLKEIPDSFFDLNVKDIKLLIKGLRAEAQGTIEQPLMTAQLREFEEEKQQLDKLNRYKNAIIRIQFPNRYVLQGTFTPYEWIQDVVDFIKPYLASPDIDFHLYTTPPKNILEKGLRLFEADCVPSAVVHFGCDEKHQNYLKKELLEKLSSPSASIKQALSDRGIKMHKEVTGRANEAPSPSTSSNHSRTVNLPKQSTTTNASSTSTATPSDSKLPKWFKTFGK